MVLNAVMSSVISPCPVAAGRLPGRSRSAAAMARASRRSGASPIRSSTALATSIATRPATTTAASAGRTGEETVTGPSSSIVATISTTALSRKIRQNSDTAQGLLSG